MKLVHFVGFRPEGGQQYWNAVRAFGLPAFVHYVWDERARREIADYDLVVFAEGSSLRGPFDGVVSNYNHDDSNEDDDPAAEERRQGIPNPYRR